MIKQMKTGCYNMTNPGTITHDEILYMYKEYKDKEHTYENYTREEQENLLKNGRSNTELNTYKLRNEYPDVLPVHEAVRWCIHNYVTI